MSYESQKLKILIIDDERSICESLSGVLEDEGCITSYVGSGEKGIAECKARALDLVFLDIWMPGMDGIQVLQQLRELNSSLPVVIMSGHATIDIAVRATRLGAFDVLEKPLELAKIVSLLEQAKSLLKSTNRKPFQHDQVELIGASPAIEILRKQIAVVGPKNASVLITGENGTGKEVVAKLIHQTSLRSHQPFVAINCAAIPEELIEGELFGHVRGAFTNAVSDRKGRFELAHNGTIFLDEIGDMSLKTQAKILRLLQEKSFERVGDNKSINVDVRVIAATNKDLAHEIKESRFREDLFYRLNVIPLVLKPLRERCEDIPLLANYFVSKLADPRQKPPVFSEEVMNFFVSLKWSGNVRELKNTIERMLIMSNSALLSMEDLPQELLGEEDNRNADFKRNNLTLKDAKNDFERAYILGRLEENDWNVSKTADVLNIERSNLHRKLKSYEINPKKLKG